VDPGWVVSTLQRADGFVRVRWPLTTNRPGLVRDSPNVTDRETRLTHRNATCAIVGAGDYIGAAIARKFAAEGYVVFAGRRNVEKLAPLRAEIEAAGGACETRALDARQEESLIAFLNEANSRAPLEVVIANPGANVHFPILETTERVFTKVWEMACKAGFLTGREAARLMLAHGRGSIFFTGATASVRGGAGYAAFSSAKAGLRMVAQSMARELGPRNIHVAHLVIDSGVDTAFVRARIRDTRGEQALADLAEDTLMNPASIADAYWMLHQQKRDAWTFEMDLRPHKETW
jgi:NAD(P)-dependent dehydrogenase (short-subunit alcohol dehydrogenase family)